MKCINLSKGTVVKTEDRITAVSGDIKGKLIKVNGLEPPSEQHPNGRIIHNKIDQTWQHLLPRVLNCVFIQDDSATAPIECTNKASIPNIILECLAYARDNGYTPRQLIVGEREMDKLKNFQSPPLHLNPDRTTTFDGVKVTHLPHHKSFLLLEQKIP